MRLLRLLMTAALLASAAGCGGGDDDKTIPYNDDGKLTVMTRNLYLGADLTPVILAGTNTQAFLAATTTVWGQVLNNDFPARAVKIADEIEAALPDLVGLQEVSLWRTQQPSDIRTNPLPNATTVAIDYLAILQSELSKRGLQYDAVVVLELFDFEVPMLTGQDVRLTDRQVILARQGVPVSNAVGQVFPDQVLLPLPVAGQTLPVKRGYTSVQATIGGQSLTFFNTHLEAFNRLPRAGQAQVLAGVIAQTPGRVVLVGDLNSPSADEPTPPTAYQIVVGAAGMTDIWSTLTPPAPGFTCCFPGILTETGDQTERIDQVLLKGATGQLVPTSADIVGEATTDRTASGLWPSDHAGVTATITP